MDPPDAPAAARLPFPAGFFERYDDAPDAEFYAPLRLVTHIDDGAIAEVGPAVHGARARPATCST